MLAFLMPLRIKVSVDCIIRTCVKISWLSSVKANSIKVKEKWIKLVRWIKILPGKGLLETCRIKTTVLNINIELELNTL